MTDDMLVTIVTMTYKKFGGVKNTINSVLSQTYKNIEYIVSDDGSNDFPQASIEQILNNGSINSYLIIHHQQNVGTVRNANEACRKAKGEIILFLSCGDVFFDNDTVQRIVNRFKTEQCEVLAVRRLAYTGDYVPLCYLPHQGALEKLGRLKTKEQQYSAYITTHYWDAVSGSALYFRKSVLEENDYFDEKYRLWEDGPFIEKYLRSNSITYAFDIIGIWYEYGGISTSNTPNPLLLEDQRLFDRTDRLIKKDDVSHYVRRCIEYINRRSLCVKKTDVLRAMLLYPDVAFSNMIYGLTNRIFASQDAKIINKQEYKKRIL